MGAPKEQGTSSLVQTTSVRKATLNTQRRKRSISIIWA